MLVPISDELYVKLLGLPKEVLLNIMLASIEEMQAYNGRSVQSVIHSVIVEDDESPDAFLLSNYELKEKFKND